MTTSRNPYTSMLLTFDPLHFFGRENEIIGILQVITAREPTSHAIYGIRTIGKSMLLKFLMAPGGALHRYESYVNAEFLPGGGRRLVFVYVSFHRYEKGDGVFRIMLENLLDHLQNDDLAHDVVLPRNDPQPTRQQAVEGLREVSRQLHRLGCRVVFLLDDFDDTLAYIDEDDDRLLRTLSDETPLIIATEAPISELRPDIGDSSPLLGILRPEVVGLLDEASARNLITQPALRAGVTFSEDEVAFLLRVAGRQPFLLVTACEHYFQTRQEYPDISTSLETDAGFENVLRQFAQRMMGFPHVVNVMQRIWSHLADNERRALVQLASRKDKNGVVNFNAIASRLATKALVHFDLKNGTYEIFSYLFHLFIEQRIPDDRVRQFDNLSHHNQEIMNQLSPIDRQLFRYLLDHTNEVCTFDELLDAVWTDGEKSKRALEAAVHRIRRILGPGEQIKNIRGKGYKFVTEALV